MANGEDQHCVQRFPVDVESHVSCAPTGNHQLPHVAADGPADIRMFLEHQERSSDEGGRIRCRGWIGLDEEVREAIEILERSRRVDDARHTF